MARNRDDKRSWRVEKVGLEGEISVFADVVAESVAGVVRGISPMGVV